MKITFLSVLLSIGFFSTGQVITYVDVAVIVNDNSQTSIDIGNYFQTARNIPNQNMIHVLAPTTEEIDSLQFEQVRAQIESHLIANNLVDSINYLVTTKGVPLKVESGCFDTIVSGQMCASFDSELTLILGTYLNQVGSSGSWANPIYGATENFSRDSSGIYLVTRLDGYTKQDVFNLIDRSGPSTGLNQQSAQAIVDLNSAVSGDSTYFMNYYLQPTYDFLINNSWNAQLDANYNPLLNQSNVFSYIYEGHGPLTNVSLGYSWSKGSISSMSTCETATTFDNSANTSDYFLIADLIAEGCTGAYGNVDCIYFSQISNSETLLSRYLDPVENYNLAESFYMAEPRLSWQGVVVGDPKSSVVIDNLANISKPVVDEISIYPNPSAGIIKISANEIINSIVVFDMKGAQVRNHNQLMSDSFELNLQGVKNGIYMVQVEINGNLMRERIVINH